MKLFQQAPKKVEWEEIGEIENWKLSGDEFSFTSSKDVACGLDWKIKLVGSNKTYEGRVTNVSFPEPGKPFRVYGYIV